MAERRRSKSPESVVKSKGQLTGRPWVGPWCLAWSPRDPGLTVKGVCVHYGRERPRTAAFRSSHDLMEIQATSLGLSIADSVPLLPVFLLSLMLQGDRSENLKGESQAGHLGALWSSVISLTSTDEQKPHPHLLLWPYSPHWGLALPTLHTPDPSCLAGFGGA